MIRPGYLSSSRHDFKIEIDESISRKLQFSVLPDYAAFLLEHKLDELADAQNRLSHELNIPILSYFLHLPETQLRELAKKNIRELLQAFSSNQAESYIRSVVGKWVNNRIPELSKNKIIPEDISILSFIRNKIFRDLVSSYTRDMDQAIHIMEEVNLYSSVADAVGVRTLLTMQQELYEQAQEIAHIGNWSLDLKTNLIEWSSELFRIYDLEPRDIVDYDLRAFNHAEDDEYVQEQMRQSRETGMPHDFYYRILLKNGEEKYLHAVGQVISDAQGRAEKMFGTLQDVTVQKKIERQHRRNEEEKRQQEDRYYKMIDEVQDYAILLLSPEGVIENWNTGAEKIKGYKSEEIVGKNFRIFYPKEDREAHLPERLILEAVQQGKARHEGWRLRKDGSRFWGNVVITALHNKDGNIIGFSKVTRDLTERKLSEDNQLMYMNNLEIKNRELEQKNKELESFGYIASHDLQEPIRKIRLWANKIEDTEPISDNVRDSLGKIQKSSIRMQKLIQGVLQYSQTEMQGVPREETDLNGVLDEVLSDFSDLLQEKKIIIERENLPVLHVVRLQFVQLFSNIISNAVKYSRENIQSVIRIKSSISTEVSDQFLPGSAYHKITISDNGIGFVQDYADKIFELFRRLESSPAYSGTGIGLAICKKIIKNHGGTIRATGIPGEGASFEICLPAE